MLLRVMLLALPMKLMTSLKPRFKKLLRLLCLIAGLVLAFYGLLLFFSLDELIFGKFSAASRETSSAVLLVLIGGAVFFYGLWSDAGE